MKQLICIVCPRGCHLSVDENSLEVTGNSCIRGAKYGVSELTNPTRVVTSTVKITGAIINRLPVKTDKAIAKEKIFDVMKILNKVEVKSPIKRGTIILENILGTSVNIVACKDL